ncbi:MAG TPA: hypothetical protein VJR94_01145 [Candidatus Nitrosocosmicus sp.]|nr:hypothetical protein [Candidatus Nitrosocosmicus sp.]
MVTTTGYSLQVFASSGLGVFLDNRSSDNKHLSFANTTDSQELNTTSSYPMAEAEN